MLNYNKQITFSNTFNVLVIATMSAGKSTLINALIGQELLHSANEATTASLTTIQCQDKTQFFSGVCYTRDGSKIADSNQMSNELMKLWNADPQVNYIRLYGPCLSPSSHVRDLLLYDTPGPNNSRDERHALIMMEALDVIFPQIVIYVLNTEQLGTNDDRKLLDLLHKKIDEKKVNKIIFILNKIDLLDIEKGELAKDVVEKTCKYLEQIGFTSVIVIPIISSAALYARKELNSETLTLRERIKLNQEMDNLNKNKYLLIRSANVHAKIKKRIRNEIYRLDKGKYNKKLNINSRRTKELRQVVACSGIRTLESIIYLSYKESRLNE